MSETMTVARATKKIRDMRRAIKATESALTGLGDLLNLPEIWGEPRQPDNLRVRLSATRGQVYRVCDAFTELKRAMDKP